MIQKTALWLSIPHDSHFLAVRRKYRHVGNPPHGFILLNYGGLCTTVDPQVVSNPRLLVDNVAARPPSKLLIGVCSVGFFQRLRGTPVGADRPHSRRAV